MAPAGVTPAPLPSFELVSISLSGVFHTFPLEHIPDLHILSELDHYAHDSGVAFLVRATRSDIERRRGDHRSAEEAGGRNTYIIDFARDGGYRKTVEIDLGMRAQRLAVFPNGNFLVFGFDPNDHMPKLVLLKEDGTYLKSIELPERTMPRSAVGTKGAELDTLIAVELVRAGSAVMVLQSHSVYPLLEISQGGAIRAVPNHLAASSRLEDLIPSDENLFALVDTQDGPERTIYELLTQDGSVRRTLIMDERRDSAAIACVNEGKLLSLDYADGKITPLVGIPQMSH